MKNSQAFGLIPQISAIMGPCAGGASYSPDLTDFIIMVEGQSHMFVTGPEVIKAVTHEDVSMEELGGARTHHQLSGVSHLVAADDKECIILIRELLDYIPSNNLEESPVEKCFDDPRRREPLLNDFIPADSRTSYDVKALVRAVVDDSSFFEVQSGYATNLVIEFARLNGKSVGIVANQPAHLAGALDTKASRKGALFVRFCDAFNIPLVTFIDVRGFCPVKSRNLTASSGMGPSCSLPIARPRRPRSASLRERPMAEPIASCQASISAVITILLIPGRKSP